MKKPNILFITTDHQRFDTLFMKQDGKEVTPHLNRLGQESCVFTRAYNSSPICVPARTALATGKYPTKNGVVFNDWEGLTAGDHKPIHQFLSEAGYRLGHSGMHHIKVKPGLQERVSFDKFIDQKDYAHYAESLHSKHVKAANPDLSKKEVLELRNGTYEKGSYSSAYSYVWDQPIDTFKDVYFTDQAVDFIEGSLAGSEPFALFLNIWAPHPPLAVPEPYASMYNPNKLQLPSNVGVPANGEPTNRRRGVPAQLAEGLTLDDWKKTWAAHLGLTSLADDCIGRVIDALKKNNQYENTIILFMSDHGDHLGQHKMYQKMEMYEQAVRVPMIIKVPAFTSHVNNDVVSHLDIVPTILDFIEVDIPDDLDGISLRTAILGETGLPDRSVYLQYSGNPVVGDIRRAVITQQYKYIYDPNNEPELYDLQQDTLEMTNLAKETKYEEIKMKLHTNLVRWAINHQDWIR